MLTRQCLHACRMGRALRGSGHSSIGGTLIQASCTAHTQRRHKSYTLSDMKKNISEMWSKYGYIAIGVYAGTYLTTLGILFFGLDSGMFDCSLIGFSYSELLNKAIEYLPDSGDKSTSIRASIEQNPRIGTFAVALFLNEFAEPIRLANVFFLCPILARR